MAELTLTAFLSLDGVMQAPGGPTEDPSGGFAHGGWVVPHIDEEFGATMDAIFARPAAFLLGRTTYDIFASHWPKVPGPDPVADKLNGLPKFVASRTRTSFDWPGTTLVRDVVKEVPELKRRFEGELQVHGSLGLAQTLIEHDLVDEYRLLVFPVLLGSGRRLFGTGTVPANLRLVSAKTTSKGTVVAVYRRGGPFTTGAIGLET
jgi:dihydrofolate reductase